MVLALLWTPRQVQCRALCLERVQSQLLEVLLRCPVEPGDMRIERLAILNKDLK